MIGIELVKDRKTKEKASGACHSIVTESIEDGVIFGESKFKGLGNVLKIKPPFVISEAQADRVLEVFEKHIKKQQDKRSGFGQIELDFGINIENTLSKLSERIEKGRRRESSVPVQRAPELPERTPGPN